MERVCVFCGSSTGAGPVYAEMGRAIGRELAGRALTLVYGGSRLGLMGAAADGALEAGGEVIGVMPEGLLPREIAHQGLTELRLVRTMHERKALMADLADAFIALPGGFGTLDELAEILTWAQIGLHNKPIVLLNQEGYYDALLAFLDHASKAGFLRPEHRTLLREARTLPQVFEFLFLPLPPPLPKILRQEDR